VITAIAGRPVRKRSEAAAALFLHPPGQAIAVTAIRDGKSVTLSMTVPQ